MRGVITLAIAGIACLTWPDGAKGQVYAFRHYGVEAGLSAAFSIAFDADGTLLVGTNDGVVRFDGFGFESVMLPGLPDTRILELTAGTDESVWGVSEEGRLFRLHRTGDVLTALLPAALGSDRALLHTYLRLRIDPSGRPCLNDNVSRLWCFDPVNGSWSSRDFGARIIDYFFDPDNTIWLATTDKVGRLSPDGKDSGVEWVLELANIVFLLPNPAYKAWVGANTDGGSDPPYGIYILEKDGTLMPAPGLGERFGAWSHSQPDTDPSGRLLFLGGYPGMQIGLYRLSADGTVELAIYAENGRPNLFRQTIFDPEGGIWAVHSGGLSHLEQEYLVSFPLIGPNGDNEIGTYLEKDEERDVLWISTWGGLYRMQGNRIIRVSPLPRRATRPPVVLRDGSVWWSEMDKEVFRFTYLNERLRPITGRGEHVLFETSDGSRYVTSPEGLFLRAGTRRAHISTYPLEAVFLAGAAGRIWFVPWRNDRYEGIDTIEGDSLGSECERCLPPSVRAVMDSLHGLTIGWPRADSAGNVWLPTVSGLMCLYMSADSTWHTRRFDVRDGLLSNEISSVYPTPDGRIWIGTWRGLQGLRILPGESLLEPLYEFRTHDGLEGEQVSTIIEDAAGFLWLVTGGGKVHRLKYREIPRHTSPSVRISRLERDGVPQALGPTPLRLSSGESVLRVHLVPQTYRQLQRVRFQYRLLGRDTVWTDLGSARLVTFASIPSGKYELEVRALRANSPPGPVARQALLAVPPFYRTWWFTFLALGLFCTPVALWYRHHVARKLAVEQIRLRIATDLHDDMGSGLTQVSLFSELIRRVSEPQAAAWAEQMGDQARALSEAMRDIVWAIHPEHETWDSLELRMKDFAAALFAPRGIEFEMHVSVENKPPLLSIDVRRNVLLLFKEVLHNAVRHADCNRVEVVGKLSRRRMWLQIRDDGCGFEPDLSGRGNGLKNLRRRAADIHADLQIDTAPGRGARVDLRVPLA